MIDLKKEAQRVMERAKHNLRRSEELLPVSFVYTPKEVLIVGMIFHGPDEKFEIYKNLIRLAKVTGALAILSVNDARMRKCKPEDFGNYRQGEMNDTNSTECLLVTVKSPGVEPWMLISRYTRSGKKISFEPAEEWPGGESSLLTDW